MGTIWFNLAKSLILPHIRHSVKVMEIQQQQQQKPAKHSVP